MKVVAVVPAKDRADSVGATVAALQGSVAVDDVLVVDDGSHDDTAERARTAGATVLRLPANVGKGAAVTAGVRAAADADVYLLVDADVAGSAALVGSLLAPVLDGRADMTVGVLPAAGSRGGFGRVRALAAWGIRRACGFTPRAPLSGQRAVRGELLRSLLPLADRFGLEVGLAVDAVRAGARVEEIEVAMDHRHTGRSMAGFRHRGRQGVDVGRALWPRLTSSSQRLAAIALLFVLLASVALWQGSRWEPSSVPPSSGASRVLVVGVPALGWDDLGTGAMPTLDRLRTEGAVAAMSVRTASGSPDAVEAYATLGAGTRVKADPSGDVVGSRELNRDRHLSTNVGALGEALAAAGRRAVVVGGPGAAIALATPTGAVETVATPTQADGDVVLVDAASPAAADQLVAEVLAATRPGDLLLVLGMTPPGDEWHLAPAVAWGAGVHRGYLHSVSTRRKGVVTLTDIAPTVLASLGVEVPGGMIGHPLQYRPGGASLAPLRELDRDALFRERRYFRLTIAYIVVQALTYLLAIVAFSRLGGAGRAGPVLRWIALAVAAWPLSTFLLRAVPDVAELDGWAVPLLVGIDLAVVWLALRARRHPLSPLGWVAGATVALLLVDVWTGARLQTSSILGYSLHTAARFTGLGNTAFAVLGATAVLAVCIHVQYAPRRREALATGAGVFGLVALTDGAPSLGSDVGGILTLVPVFGLVFLVLSGRRLSWRLVLVAAGVTVVALLGVAFLDYLRPVESRTHLGRLVADMRDQGWEPFTTTVNRKLAGNLKTFGSPWTWTIPVITAYMLFMLAWARGYQRVLPRGSALRAAAVGMLAAGVLGNVVNDSGIVVTALVFVYLGPLMTTAALARERGEPVLLPAERSTVGTL